MLKVFLQEAQENIVTTVEFQGINRYSKYPNKMID